MSGDLSPVLAEMSIERATTAERTAAALRDQILNGSLAPGTRLREVEIARALGVSRNTVRETLAILVGEGLLTRSSYKGVVVTQLSATDVTDIFRARRTIELAAADAIAQADDRDLAQLIAAAERFIEIARADVGDAAHVADTEVHFTLVRLLGSERLSNAHATLLAELRLLLSPRYDAESRDEEIERHETFAELVRRRDAAAARAQLDQRLRDSETDILRSL